MRARAALQIIALLLLWLCAIVSLTPAHAAPSGTNWLIVPGVRAGPITATTSVADLIKVFGRANVQETGVRLGEAEARPGAVIYPGDPTRRAEIVWKEPNRKRFPEVFIITAHQTNKSLWQTPQGITLGITLQEVERLNGRPFLLTGFGWDGEGVVTSWRGGRLENPLGQKFMLKFEPTHPDPVKAVGQAFGTISGYQTIRSDYWVVQKLILRVFQIAISF